MDGEDGNGLKLEKFGHFFLSLNTVYSKNRQKFCMGGFLVKINLKFSFWFVGNVVTCECKYQVSISSQL